MANYAHASATTLVKTGVGRLYGIFVSTTSSGTLKIYDSLDTTTTSKPVIADTITVTAGTTYLNIPEGISFKDGLLVVLGSTASFTVFYA